MYEGIIENWTMSYFKSKRMESLCLQARNAGIKKGGFISIEGNFQ